MLRSDITQFAYDGYNDDRLKICATLNRYSPCGDWSGRFLAAQG